MFYNIFEQFEIFKIIPFAPFGIDLSFTNASTLLVISLLFFIFLFSSNVKGGFITPTRWQSVLEIIYETMYDVARENIGQNAGKYFPFIFSIFMFVLILNTFGLIPYVFTPTAHMAITFGLSVSIFIGVVILGFMRNGINYFSMFMPAGSPLWLAPLMIVIELISHLVKGLSLGIRLAANITAGHVLSLIVAGFVWTMFTAGGFLSVASIIPFAIILAITFLEIGVAFIQAYVFSLLTAIYIGESENLH